MKYFARSIWVSAVLVTVGSLTTVWGCHIGSASATQSASTTPQQVGKLRFPKLAPRAGYIIGRAVLEDGTPVPQFHITAAGFNGKFDSFLNNKLDGPQIRKSQTTLVKGDGANGRYAIPVTDEALFYQIRCQAAFKFHGVDYMLDLWPTDNLVDDTSEGSFRGYSKGGIVRDFVLKMDGALRPGHKAALYPDHRTNLDYVASEATAYFGGEIYCDCAYGANYLYNDFPAGSIVTLTLTSTGPRVDGLPARTITRSSPAAYSLHFFGIPFAAYTASAQITEPNGTIHPVRISEKFPLGSGFTWQASAPVEWAPLASNPSIIVATTIYLTK